MEHALGLSRKKKTYRNRFYTQKNDSDWDDLVDKGLAVKRKGWEDDMAYFHVTEKGAELLGVKLPD